MTEQPQKTPRKYLPADDIIDVLHNANKQFPHKEIGKCPIAKTPEDQEYS